MPGGDRTGPGGMGPMTGRAAGYCAGYSAPGYANPVAGRGYGGWGRGGGGGGGWGRRNWYYATGLTGWQRAAYGYPAAAGAPYAPPAGVPPAGAPYVAPYAQGPTREQEMEMLKSQAEYLGEALKNIDKRLEELQAAAEDAEQST